MSDVGAGSTRPEANKSELRVGINAMAWPAGKILLWNDACFGPTAASIVLYTP